MQLPDKQEWIPCCSPVSSAHQKVLHVYSIGINWAGYDEMALCRGEFSDQTSSRLYVVYCAKSITGQMCLEFFVDDDFIPETTLHYIEDPEAKDEVKALMTG